jgi:predicted RNA-binding protein YlqC (UPF0109 family)
MNTSLHLAQDEFLVFGTHLVSVMAKALVNHPDQVSVEIIVGENTTVFKIHTAQEDLGQIIGRKGANIAHLREIIKIYSSKSKRRAVLEIVDPIRQTSYEVRTQPQAA